MEYGGQWVGPTQDRVLGLIREFGLETFAQYADGDNVQLAGGALLPYSGAIPTGDPVLAADLIDAMVEMTTRAMELDPAEPWAHPLAVTLDAMTLESWIAAQPYCDPAKEWIRLLSRALFPADPGEVSVLHALFYLRSGGGPEKMIGVVNSAQQTRITGGAQQLALRLADLLGNRVRLSSPVHRIDTSQRGVTVRCESGAVAARRVIVAVPPALADRIRYSPALPGLRDQLTQRSFMGAVIKVHVFYSGPFWRAAGFSGHATSDQGLLRLTFDQTHPAGREGALVGFVDSHLAFAAARMTAAERRAAVVSDLVRIFGEQASGRLTRPGADPGDLLLHRIRVGHHQRGRGGPAEDHPAGDAGGDHRAGAQPGAVRGRDGPDRRSRGPGHGLPAAAGRPACARPRRPARHARRHRADRRQHVQRRLRHDVAIHVRGGQGGQAAAPADQAQRSCRPGRAGVDPRPVLAGGIADRRGHRHLGHGGLGLRRPGDDDLRGRGVRRLAAAGAPG